MSDMTTWEQRRVEAVARAHTSGMLGSIEFDDPWEDEELAPVDHDLSGRRNAPAPVPRVVRAGEVIAVVEQEGTSDLDPWGLRHPSLDQAQAIIEAEVTPAPRARLRVERAIGGWRVRLVNAEYGTDVEMRYASTYEEATSYARGLVRVMTKMAQAQQVGMIDFEAPYLLPTRFMLGAYPPGADGPAPVSVDDEMEIEVPGCWA